MVQTVQTNHVNPANGEPMHIAAMMHNAISQHQGGQLQKAESIYQAVLRELPHHPDALHNLGVLAHQTGNHLVAIDLIGRAINVNPRVISYYINRGEAYRAIQKSDAAVASFMQALAMKPNHAPTHNFLGLALQDAGKLDEAINHYRQALTLNPNMAEAYNNLGLAHVRRGHIEDAIYLFSIAVQIPKYRLSDY